jgi:thiosulfate dehydrogenase
MKSNWFPILLGLVILIVIISKLFNSPPEQKIVFANTNPALPKTEKEWVAPDINSLPDNEEGKMVRYGRDLIAVTSKYLGPKGTVAAITNGMNCQNCHTEAGTKPYQNCFSAVASMYPQFRPRSGIIESVEFRINDCLMRSLNGKTIDSTSKEMRAMVAYLEWLGKDVPEKTKPPGAGTEELPFLNRAADTSKGRLVFQTKCVICHGANGEGMWNSDSSGFVYPPLWGAKSYNTGAGLYRLTRFAGYVKSSMPFGTASHENPQLSDEEAWDVAAFVNSQPRPHKNFNKDWPDLSKKAIDHPFGPYDDKFTEQQHKYGPFGPIKKAREEKLKNNAGKK